LCGHIKKQKSEKKKEKKKKKRSIGHPKDRGKDDLYSKGEFSSIQRD
jgi:hypothetical protein